MKSIGGFLDLELCRGTCELHTKARRFNSARSGLLAICEACKIRRLYLPRYICPVVPNVLRRFGVEVCWYDIENFLEPCFEKLSEKNVEEWALVVDYFGLCRDKIRKFAKESKRLIVDNSQAFFSEPIEGTSAIYSVRKWLGVPDGGYAYCDVELKSYLKANSDERLKLHIERLVLDSGNALYKKYCEIEQGFDDEPILETSDLTRSLLSRIDYDFIRKRRRENFQNLSERLADFNQVSPVLDEVSVPMFYPFVTDNASLRNKLIENGVYVPSFWRGIEEWTEENSFERRLTERLIPIPIDQRYDEADMSRVASLTNRLLK